ncbi:hypothetical protein H5V45_07085 [Nocardioides sp. KIGAM211]|uniref:Uncharacterized protein n=1 Tax=Nocardioides luti TaxID=2761101 RepID=A0A7X0RHF0_9ACTN|nr:hypothetical protein [Nocardioides luti]MBB6627083.1 hypothetical protein [Nocardioides luti]
MMIRIALAGTLFLALTGCGGATTASDPAGDPSGSPTGSAAAPDDGRPTEVPAADGPVATRTIVTVMDTGEGLPQLCLGAVAESYPPQCGGPELRGWSWADQQGVFEHQGDVRWGMFVVTGTFDGTAMDVTHAIPAALYDAAPVDDGSGIEPPDTQQGLGGKQDPRRAEIATDLEQRPLPGQLSVVPTEVSVVVDVVHDDGTIQDWADATYGEGVVEVISALVTVGR